MKKRKSRRCSDSAKTQIQLHAELSGYRELLYERIRQGWRAYFVTLQLPETNFSGQPLLRKIKTGAGMFMQAMTARFSGQTESDLDLRPVAVFALDRRDRKSNKIEPTIHPANEGLHLHGIVLVHPKSHRQKLKDDVKDNRKEYEFGRKLMVHVVRIKKNPGKVFDYALKGFAKRQFDTDEIMVFPLSRSELSKDRDTTYGASHGTIKESEYVDKTMSALRDMSEEVKKGKVTIAKFMSMAYIVARGLDKRFGLKAGIMVRQWLLRHEEAGVSVPRYSSPTYAVVLGAANVERKTRSKYKLALEGMMARFGSSLSPEEFEDKLTLAGGVSGVVTARRDGKASGKKRSTTSRVGSPIPTGSASTESIKIQLKKPRFLRGAKFFSV